MDLERIERALREGPVDEPLYRPGAFRRPRHAGASVLLISGAVGAALLIGVVFGMALEAMQSRDSRVGASAPDLEALSAQLAGSWVSDPISRDDFVSFMLELGHDPSDIDAFHFG